jgi:hypothetical protein
MSTVAEPTAVDVVANTTASADGNARRGDQRETPFAAATILEVAARRVTR